jgi:hypothetical protein
MRQILTNKIEEIDRNIEFFNKELLPKYRQESYKGGSFSLEYFQNKMKTLTNLRNKRSIYLKRLEHLNKLVSIEKSIGYVKDFIQLNQQICFLSYSSSNESIKVMVVEYKNMLTSTILLEETFENKESLNIILNKAGRRFICFDKTSLFKLLDKKEINYDKLLFSDVQRMSLFFYGDLTKIYSLEKLYEDIPIFKEENDNSLRKIKNIFEGIIYS